MDNYHEQILNPGPPQSKGQGAELEEEETEETPRQMNNFGNRIREQNEEGPVTSEPSRSTPLESPSPCANAFSPFVIVVEDDLPNGRLVHEVINCSGYVLRKLACHVSF